MQPIFDPYFSNAGSDWVGVELVDCAQGVFIRIDAMPVVDTCHLFIDGLAYHVGVQLSGRWSIGLDPAGLVRRKMQLLGIFCITTCISSGWKSIFFNSNTSHSFWIDPRWRRKSVHTRQ
jgi:hypothetical protein